MKTLNIIAAILISTSVLFAANEKAPAPATTTISGTVIDKTTGEVLAGVKIEFNNSEKTVYSDLDGNFELKDVVPGNYKISTSLISYESNTIEVDCAKKTDKIKISLDNN